MGEVREALVASHVHHLLFLLVKCDKLLRVHRWSEAADLLAEESE